MNKELELLHSIRDEVLAKWHLRHSRKYAQQLKEITLYVLRAEMRGAIT
jgi:hypothetical protein